MEEKETANIPKMDFSGCGPTISHSKQSLIKNYRILYFMCIKRGTFSIHAEHIFFITSSCIHVCCHAQIVNAYSIELYIYATAKTHVIYFSTHGSIGGVM